jgi:hypothetical protein
MKWKRRFVVPGYAVNDMFDHLLHWQRHLCLKRQLNAAL